MKTLYLSILLSATILHVSGQCFPEGAESCKSTRTLCSIVELNGLSCSTLDFSNSSGPAPLCCDRGLGVPSNIIWWSFVGDGSDVKISFDFVSTDCEDNRGLQAGILDNCNNMDDNYGSVGVLDCNAECNLKSFTLRGKTINCQTYYVWVDGCEGDICNFTIYSSGGSAPKLPDNPPPPKVIGSACQGGKVKICGADFPDCNPVYIWYKDGTEYQKSRYECIELKLPKTKTPIELCLKYFLGNGYDPVPLCGEVTKCITIVPEATSIIDEGIAEVCQVDGEYKWHGYHPDSVLNGALYKVKVQEGIDSCFVEYRADSIIYLPASIGPDRNVLICDKNDLPFISEDGFKWSSEACGKIIRWSNTDGCDTSYKLNLSLFLPEVRLSQECGACDGFTRLKAKIYYIEPCSPGIFSINSFWLNSSSDTVGIGNEIQVYKSDEYAFGMNVIFTDTLNGDIQEYCLIDTSKWFIKVDHMPIQSAVISGPSSICDSVIGRYYTEKNIQNICEYDWYIKNGKGTILTTNSTDSSSIDILWHQKDGVDASVCVTLKTMCQKIEESCFNVAIHQSPQIQNIAFECNPDNTSYRISLNIEGGDKQSTEIQDTSGWKARKIDSTIYSTKWIPNGSHVALRIFDKNRCSINSLDTFYKCTTVGIIEKTDTKYQLFPNPSSGFIYILGQDLEETDISFINIQGEIIRNIPRQKVKGGIKLKLQNNESGMYFIRMLVNNNSEILRFIKL